MLNSRRTSAIVRLITGVVLLLTSSLLAAGTRVEINDEWRFRTDPASEGEKLGWTNHIPQVTEAVRIPHTWNIGVHEDYTGPAWYFRSFPAPDSRSGKHVEINFGATFYKSRVWLNGKLLGEHEGGYTAYHFDITPYLKDTNFLAVEIDNRPGAATIPGLAQRLGERAWYDWWHYGGIVRDVWLTINDSALIRRQAIRSSVQAGNAEVTDTIFVDNFGKTSTDVEVLAEVQADGDSKVLATQRQRITLARGENKIPVKLAINNPRLWDFDHPNLYRISVTLNDRRGRAIDQHADTFGVRTVEIRDRHLLLNGERVRLTGMTRHEESPWEGLAETRGTMLHDYTDLKNLQVTLTRPVHYPQHPFILDFADRNGIMLMPEVPLWQFTEKQLSDPKVLALAKQQMREMVEQAGNHPSIFAWSVCNESETNKPGGVAYFRAMKQFLNEIDPGRFVTYADNNLAEVTEPDQNAAYYADFIMMNQYFGTWAGPRTGLVPALDKLNRDYPSKMVIISEFGAAGFFEPNETQGDRLRTSIMREQLAEFAKRDWIAGAIFWCYQDYKSHRNLWPGLTEGQVSMGIVDADRQRRPSYDAWRKLNAPATITASFNDWYKVPTAFTMTVKSHTESQLPSYSLRDYRVVWELRDERQKLIASDEQTFSQLSSETIQASWKPTGHESKLTLHIRLIRPTGFVAAERTFTWRDKSSGESFAEDVTK